MVVSIRPDPTLTEFVNDHLWITPFVVHVYYGHGHCYFIDSVHYSVWLAQNSPVDSSPNAHRRYGGISAGHFAQAINSFQNGR